MTSEPSIAIVIPAYNAAHWLPRVLTAAMTAGPDALLVIDPASSDGTAEVAEELGASVIRLPEQCGPARARNLGAERVDSDVLLFIDSDCVPAPDVVKRVREAFAADPELVSLTGSYDDTPPDPGFFSQYMNLRHHHTHQEGALRDPASFWAGCGAVRRDVFQAVGGFDAERYPSPQIEDIELGLRLAEHGRTRLDPELQVTHLKNWTLRSVVETDIFARGLPWSRLILERDDMPNDLNLRSSQRVAAALAPLVLLALVAAPFVLIGGSWTALALCVGVVGVSAAIQLPMLRSFARLRGLRFALLAWAFHQVHLLYSGITFTLCWLRHHVWPVRSSWKNSP